MDDRVIIFWNLSRFDLKVKQRLKDHCPKYPSFVDFAVAVLCSDSTGAVYEKYNILKDIPNSNGNAVRRLLSRLREDGYMQRHTSRRQIPFGVLKAEVSAIAYPVLSDDEGEQ